MRRTEYEYSIPFTALAGNRIKAADFLVTLDVCGMLAIDSRMPAGSYIRNGWKDIFPSLECSPEIDRACQDYFNGSRYYIDMIALNARLPNRRSIIKALTNATVLLMLSESDGTAADQKKLVGYVINALKDVIRNLDLAAEYAYDQLGGYFREEQSISRETLQYLRKNYEVIKRVFTDLRSRMGQNPGKSEYPHTEYEHTETSGISPLRFTGIMCLLYLAIEEKQNTGKRREECIESKWSQIFEETPFIPGESVSLIDRDIKKDSILTMINMLFDHELKEIMSGKIVRIICLTLCVNAVIAQTKLNLSHEIIEDQALELFSKFHQLSAGFEKDDIEKYVRRFTTNEGTIDNRISAVLWKCYRTIRELLKQAIEYSNSDGSMRREDSRERLVSEHNRAINELKSQLYTQKANTIYKLIDMLTSPNYNYVLSRIYRFAYGYDEPSYSELRINAKNLIQILRLFGANATGEDIIGAQADDKLCREYRIQKISMPDMQENQVVFPGWDVLGDTVKNPVAVKNREE